MAHHQIVDIGEPSINQVFEMAVAGKPRQLVVLPDREQSITVPLLALDAFTIKIDVLDMRSQLAHYGKAFANVVCAFDMPEDHVGSR